MIECWHGGRENFDGFIYEAIGSGEGAALGFGFYFSEHREGGEYFAQYMNFRNGTGFLYRVLLNFTNNELLDLDTSLEQQAVKDKNKLQLLFGSESNESTLHSVYKRFRLKVGDKQASEALMRAGVKVVKSDEGTKPGHGFTFLVLDNARIIINETYQYISATHTWLNVAN